MPEEIERKFLLKETPPDLDRSPSTLINQGYLAREPEGNEVRLRKEGEDYFLTVKAKVKTGTRLEREIPLSREAFETLWSATESRRLSKKRYRVPWQNGLTLEVDVYKGANAGLIIAEVEFPDEKSGAAFKAPEWFGEEVTGRPEYDNASLAKE